MKKFTLLAASCFMALAAAAQTSYVTPATDIESGEPSFDFNGTTNYVILYASEDEVDALGETKILKNEILTVHAPFTSGRTPTRVAKAKASTHSVVQAI